ncbi:S9 family peptidase [Candidatus Acetothermia bacterium]|jgi:dipeptidyl aminopeptidase/acylaminoacyl peptidase|nr:S9 family peptidase [Candidatus Acetothermia bacterium]MCI2431582.1 S9 family peptidase [Candidatus Acetothermia bacterium]MCI2435852.1 S9 family peptidase [Candidatus Acetothermia bacterium]
MSKRPIVAEDLMKLQYLGDPQISPDGRRVIFTVKTVESEKNRYLSHLWLADTESGDVRPFTFGEVSDASPRWSPDGKRIAFLRTKEKRTQIWLIPADGGEACQLTKLDEGGFSSLAWAPDGQKLAFAFRPTHPDWTQEALKKREESKRSNPPRIITRMHYRLDGFGFLDMRQHIWVCDAATGQAQQITDGDYDDHDLAWSPDGKYLAFVSNRSADPDDRPYIDQEIWIVPMTGGKLKKLPAPIGTKHSLAWHKNQIAYLASDDREDPWVPRHTRLWVVAADGSSEARCLTQSLDRTLGSTTLTDTQEAFSGGSSPIWSADGQKIFFIVSDQGNAHGYSVALDGQAPVALTNGPLNVVSASADRAEKFALLISRPTRPAEVFICSLTGSTLTLRALTKLNEAFLNEVQISEPEEVWFSSKDGTNLQGWLLKPINFDPKKKYPLVLYVHGGPHAQYGNAFFHEFQYHAARGYLVFYTNPRGSTGREESFASAIRGHWGNLDFQDIMAAADYGASLPYIDAKRMAIAGGSYGGYMTNWVVGQTDRFKCAITDRSVVNLLSDFGTCDFPGTIEGYWAGDAWERTEPRWSQSPLKYVQNIKTPLLIIHSEGDLRCPIEQAEQLFIALKRLKREVVFVRYPKETSHGLSRSGPPDLRLDRLQRISAWLDRYLGG